MSQSSPRLLLGLALASWLSLSSRAQAVEPRFQASLSCQPAAGPGRVLCELRAHATEGKLVWSDALVVRAPAFARPLRSRFVAQVDSSSAALGASARLALVASAPGEGKLELLARGVICLEGPNGEWCAPVQAPVTVEIRVPPSDPAPQGEPSR
jgi:hypothetical protein